MARAYTAFVRRIGKWWAIEVPEVPGALGQVRRLDQAEAAAREAIAFVAGIPESDVHVTVLPFLNDSSQAALRLLELIRVDADLAARVEAQAVREAIHALAERGLSTRDIGVLLGLSHQRVAQLHAEPLEVRRDLPSDTLVEMRALLAGDKPTRVSREGDDDRAVPAEVHETIRRTGETSGR